MLPTHIYIEKADLRAVLDALEQRERAERVWLCVCPVEVAAYWHVADAQTRKKRHEIVGCEGPHRIVEAVLSAPSPEGGDGA
jgi:hypothetical protein